LRHRIRSLRISARLNTLWDVGLQRERLTHASYKSLPGDCSGCRLWRLRLREPATAGKLLSCTSLDGACDGEGWNVSEERRRGRARSLPTTAWPR
jgi:hypothetical protein